MTYHERLSSTIDKIKGKIYDLKKESARSKGNGVKHEYEFIEYQIKTMCFELHILLDMSVRPLIGIKNKNTLPLYEIVEIILNEYKEKKGGKKWIS